MREAMWRERSAQLAFTFAFVGAACGARTGFDAGGSQGTEQADGSSSGASDHAYCSELLGPVDACLETAATGPVGDCSPSHCVLLPGLTTWGCCSGHPPYNGPNGVCGGVGQLGTRCPTFRASGVSPGQPEIDECLPAAPPEPSGFEPDCLVVAARFPSGTASPSEVAACQACDAPGLSAPPAAIVESQFPSVSNKLSQYDCLCLVQAANLARCPETTPQSTPSWCYSNVGDRVHCSTPWLAIYTPPDFEADLYVACFSL